MKLYTHFRFKTPDKILLHFNLNNPPFDIQNIIRYLGIEIIQVKQAGWSGACRFNQDYAQIWVSLEESEHRQRFTLAHELGHIILHPYNTEFRDYTNPCAINLSYKEQQANDFAFKVLMPEWSIRVSVDYIGTKVSKLAAYYGVSEAAMEMRLRQLYR